MTTKAHIASDITHLVQHVALNESGWWDNAVERLVLACAYTLGHSSQDDVVTMLVESCGIQPNAERLNSTIKRLIDSGDLIESSESLRVSEATRAALRQQEDDILQREKDVRTRFIKLSQDRGLEDQVNELWRAFETEVVLPVVRHMGARMYELLMADPSGGNGDLETTMNELLARRGDQIRTYFADFLDPNDDEIRSFVLRRLNAQYAVDAAALPDDALERLSQLDNKAKRVDIFIDTNFLFSVLGLHENPNDNAANDLLHLVQEVKEKVNLRLYVLRETVDETRRVLRDNITYLPNVHGKRNLAEAASRETSGLASCYFEAARSAPHPLTPKDFFSPYESDLLILLKGKDVELYNEDLSHLHMNAEVVNDIHSQTEVQNQYRQRGAKTYEANLHDMVLWHFCHSRRPPLVESPLEATTWIATLDYGFIKFDRQKQQGKSKSELPICLEPSSLIQLFQFWTPSSTTLDEALVGSVRQPLLFLTFDKPSEQVTMRILSAISRFEGIGDLDADTTSKILTNQALRNRLEAAGNDPSDDPEIVKEGMVEVVRQLKDEITGLECAKAQDGEHVADLEKQLSEATQTIESQRKQQTDVERQLASETDRRRNAEDDNHDLTSRLTDLEIKHEELSRDLQSQNEKTKRRQENRRIVAISAVTTVLSSATLVVAGVVLDRWLGPFLAWLSGASGGLLLLLYGTEFAARGTRFSESRSIRSVSRIRHWWWTVLLPITVAVIANLLVPD